VETYDQGLRNFPRSLDLAYNKARVQLEIVTHPLLLKRLNVPVLNGLEEALLSHRYALSLDPENPDTLFNTAQVLTTIAEELAKVNDEATAEVLKFLEEALELQGKCLSIQELKFEESESQQQAMLDQAEPQENLNPQTAVVEPDSDVDAAEQQWFSVIEPITTTTLTDTCLAQLATLTTLCSVLSSSSTAPPSPSLSWIENFSSTLITTKLVPIAQTTTPLHKQEIALAKATFLSAFLEASFHQSLIDAGTYKQERDNAFSNPDLQLEQNSEGLIANAQSLMSFSSALADHPNPPQDFYGQRRYNALSSAITTLTNASKLPNLDNEILTKTHLLRAESSLLLYNLSLPPTNHNSAIAHAPQLLKNAEVFFRNASRLSGDEEESGVAGLRCAVAQILQQHGTEEREKGKEREGVGILEEYEREKGREWVEGQIREMVEEGLLGEEDVRRMM
jgi:hypothetical protein